MHNLVLATEIQGLLCPKDLSLKQFEFTQFHFVVHPI